MTYALILFVAWSLHNGHTAFSCRNSLTIKNGYESYARAPSRMNMINYYYYMYYINHVWNTYINTMTYTHTALPIARIMQ